MGGKDVRMGFIIFECFFGSFLGVVGINLFLNKELIVDFLIG